MPLKSDQNLSCFVVAKHDIGVLLSKEKLVS
jgi:hypothetical protein